MRVGIAGLGLIGGSAGLAWRAAGHTVLGYARRAETRRLALERGAVDEAPDSLSGIAGADVVVLAAPVLAVRDLFGELAPRLGRRTVVTDVASTKRDVMRWAAALLPAGARFVGGHPMAGKEQAGIEHADGALFRGRTWCVVPPLPRESGASDPEAEATVAGLAESAGAVVVRLGAAEHDRAVAATSHLPFMAAAVLCQAVVAREGFPRLAPVAGSGLRDTTRLASGDPLMHRDICLTNRDYLIEELEGYAARVGAVARLLRRLPDADEASTEETPGAAGAAGGATADLEALFRDLKRARDAWLGARP